jgi:hypothetical protein
LFLGTYINHFLPYYLFHNVKKTKTARNTLAKSKEKEKLTKVKNLLLLPRQRCQKMFLMAANLFFKIPRIGNPTAQSDIARDCFPTRVTRGNYQTLGKPKVGSF